MKDKKKVIKIVAITIIVALVAFLVYFIYLQTLVARGELIKFDGKWFKKDDWHELFGEYDTPAKNTPEEVYTQFRQALLDGDKETALGLIRVESREEYREAFGDEVKFLEWSRNLPEALVKESEEGNYAKYDVDMGTEYKNSAMFIKNREGYWEIDAI